MVEKPGIKIIDFDDFVFFTTESKSIILMPGFSQKTTPRCDESHKYGLFYSLRASICLRQTRLIRHHCCSYWHFIIDIFRILVITANASMRRWFSDCWVLYRTVIP